MILQRIKNKIARVVTNYKEDKYLQNVILNKSGVYEFSKYDLELYKIEKRAIMPTKKVNKYSDELKTISIKSHEIYWPSSVSDDDLPWLYHEIFDNYEENPSSYDNPNMNYEKADWIIDAGCCEGFFSLFSFDKNKNCCVIALEPLQEMEKSLYKTFENKVTENKFILEQKALGKDCGTVLFSFNNEHLCDSSMQENISCNQNSKNTVYEVEVTSLDILMKNHDLKENGIIKMDIEGAEMDALKGG